MHNCFTINADKRCEYERFDIFVPHSVPQFVPSCNVVILGKSYLLIKMIVRIKLSKNQE